jgi:hypothetical protein
MPSVVRLGKWFTSSHGTRSDASTSNPKGLTVSQNGIVCPTKKQPTEGHGWIALGMADSWFGDISAKGRRCLGAALKTNAEYVSYMSFKERIGGSLD